MSEQLDVQNQMEEGLTFGEIFRLLKKGTVALTVSLIICVILCTSILLVFREVIGTTSYETEITFSSASISDDEGYNPSAAVNTLIKSDTIISTALSNLGYTADEQIALKDQKLAAHLSAYTSEQKDDSEGIAYPYKVTLSLRKMGSKTLSKAQSSALIEEITKQVILALIQEYKYNISFDKLGDISFAQYNYLQVYEKLSNTMDSVNAFKSSLSKNALEYKKNGVSVKSAFEQFDAISSELNVIKLALINGVISNPDASTELAFAKDRAKYYTDLEGFTSAQKDKYKEYIENIKPDVTVTSGTVAADALKDYYALAAKYEALEEEYKQVCLKQSEWSEIETKYTAGPISTDTEKTIQASYNAIIASYNSAFDTLNGLIEAYNEDQYASSLVSKTGAVSTVKDSAISSLIIALVDVVVIALVMVIIVIVEKKKEEKKGITTNKQEVKS